MISVLPLKTPLPMVQCPTCIVQMYVHPLAAPAAMGGDIPIVCCCFVPLLPEEQHNRVRATCELPKGKISK